MMSELLEMKERIKKLYIKNEAYILPLLKFLLAMVLLITINSKMGYMEKIDSFLVVAVAALFCSFMPMPAMMAVAGLFILLHYYALSIECAIVALALLIIMFLLYIRLVPDETVFIVITPILFALKIPYMVPILAGLFGGPVSIVSVSFGVVISCLLEYTNKNAAAITTMTTDVMASKLRFILDGIMGNDGMLVMIIAFAVTLLVVYFIRKSSMDYSWNIAIISGALTDVVILMLGELLFELEYSIIWILLGSVVAIGVCMVAQFFTFHLDYTRMEKVQFEDDEYYYYVKAVPKICVTTEDKKVKKINTKRETGSKGNVSHRNISGTGGSREKISQKGNSAKRTGTPSTIRTAHGVARTTKERQRVYREQYNNKH